MRRTDSDMPMALKIIIFYLGIFMLAFTLFVPRVFSADSIKDAKAPGEAVKTEGAIDAETKERSMLAAIERRERELNEREEAVRLKEERLNALKADIDRKIGELARMHSTIELTVKKIDTENEERVKRIVKIYESMSPEEVAERVEKLSEHIAVMLLSHMSEKKAAKVLGLVNVDKSVRLTQLLKTSAGN